MDGQLLAISQATIILYPCVKLCYIRREEMIAFPQRLVLDVIWLVSGKGQAWTNVAECELILKNPWNVFPPDIIPEEPGLPIATAEPPVGVTNSLPNGVRARHCTIPIKEEDIVDQMLRARGRSNNGTPAGFGCAD